jgi:hypothetical protein
MKKIISLSLTMILIFTIAIPLGSCRLFGSKDVESVEEKAKEGESLEGLPEGFPDSVPIHPDSKVIESNKETSDGKTSFIVKLEFDGNIKQLSSWYEKSLPDNWSIDSKSEGDFDTWSEFYVDAQNDDYIMSLYLYQDKGSDIVSIDINLKEKDKIAGEEVEETAAEGAQAETEEAGEETAVGGVSYSGELENAKIAFVCASVGSNWNINEHFPNLDIQVYDEYQFDKGNRIREILSSNKPDIMIIKECAAYFPPDSQGSSMSAYQDLIRDWVNLCRGEHVIPVLTTVVPIDPNNPSNWAGQLESILEYNDWIRDYCRDENISVLDLEKALRVSDSDRTLNPRYDSGDGLHPNDIAYSEKLDPILIPALENAIEIGY